MSYDLVFPGADQDAARELFADRGYAIRERDATFENEDTGVYWTFWFGDELAFELNYYRPHVFGLEAALALTELVGELELAIFDPQSDGMSNGPYTPEGFLRGWNHGNRFAHTGIAKMHGAERPRTLPSARNAAMWRWNFARSAVAEGMIDLIDEVPPCFIPTVMAIVRAGESAVKTCVIWDLEMAIAIPEVDLVVTGTKSGLLAAPRTDVVTLLDRHSRWPEQQHGLAADLFDDTPAAVRAKLRALMKPLQATRIPTDQLLDEELVAEAFR